MPVLVHKVEHLLAVSAYFGSQILVIEGIELPDDSVEHCGSEYTVAFENLAVILQCFCRGGAAVGQRGELGEFFLVLVVVDVHAHVELLGALEGVVQLKWIKRH